jgi:hypothetical protein
MEGSFKRVMRTVVTNSPLGGIGLDVGVGWLLGSTPHSYSYPKATIDDMVLEDVPVDVLGGASSNTLCSF